MVGAAVVAVDGVVVGASVDAGVVEASSVSMQLAVHSAPSPPLLRLFDRNSTLRVRPFTVTSGELSSQNLECHDLVFRCQSLIMNQIYNHVFE